MRMNLFCFFFLQPIIVYGVKFVKSFRGEDIGYARFEGLYLPLLWEQSFCIKSPIALGYTRGHFSALVPTEPYSRIDAARDDSEDVTFLPLMDCEQKLLPIHFLTQNEVRTKFFFSCVYYDFIFFFPFKTEMITINLNNLFSFSSWNRWVEKSQ